MTCKSYHDLDPRNDDGGFLVNLSDLQESCRYCSLLRRLVRHFAPSVEVGKQDLFLHIDQQVDHVIDVEVAASDAVQGQGSATTAAVFYTYNPSSS